MVRYWDESTWCPGVLGIMHRLVMISTVQVEPEKHTIQFDDNSIAQEILCT